MDAAQVKALASDLSSTLGLLGQLVTELENHRDQWDQQGRVRELVARLAKQRNLDELPTVLLRAHAEITEILGGIRLTREAIEAHAVERIRETQSKLTDVTSTTESATLELMNGLDRSLELINNLEEQAAGKAAAGGFQALRDQVSALYNHLQFQDITAQQLAGVTQSLLELEVRVSAVAALFNRTLGAAFRAESASAPAAAAGPVDSAHLAYNPDATMKRTRADQTQVDVTFAEARNGQPAEPGCAASPRA